MSISALSDLSDAVVAPVALNESLLDLLLIDGAMARVRGGGTRFGAWLDATCDRVAVLAEKKVIAVGTIPELLATEHPWIQDYFNGPRGRAAADCNQTHRAG